MRYCHYERFEFRLVSPIIKRPEHHKFVLENTNFRVDLNNIEILNYINYCLENCVEINLEAIKELSTTTTTTTQADLFSVLQENPSPLQ